MVKLDIPDDEWQRARHVWTKLKDTGPTSNNNNFNNLATILDEIIFNKYDDNCKELNMLKTS